MFGASLFFCLIPVFSRIKEQYEERKQHAQQA